MAHVILFEHQYLFGAHKHVFDNPFPTLYRAAQGDDPDMNDETSSMVILEGSWEFFQDKLYKNSLGTLGPGLYPEITLALGGDSNDKITSLRPVDSGGSSSLLLNILSNIKSEIIKVEEIIERPKHGR